MRRYREFLIAAMYGFTVGAMLVAAVSFVLFMIYTEATP